MPAQPAEPSTRILLVGSGHLAFRLRTRFTDQGCEVVHRAALERAPGTDTTLDVLSRVLQDVDLDTIARVFLVDDSDERNLELLIALISLHERMPIVVSLFNENVAPHLQAANPNIRVINPAKIAAPTFVNALDAPRPHKLRYAPSEIPPEPKPLHTDRLIATLAAAFAVVLAGATAYFHSAEHLGWLDALYFVVVTTATVGYGDINLLNAGATSKIVGIALILVSTAFIWTIFSLTVDSIIKRRVQLALGRRRYTQSGHVILCGLGRLGSQIGEGLLARGEKLLIIEKEEHAAKVDQFRRRGVDVYIGDARLPRVLQDAGVSRAKALYSVTDNDFANLEIGLNARSFDPTLRLILRIFDEATSKRLAKYLDIHLAYSMSGVVSDGLTVGRSDGQTD